MELTAVSTNPKKFDHPLSVEQAYETCQQLASRFELLLTSLGTFFKAFALARQIGVTGNVFYDLFIAATMQEHGIRHIFTYDHIFARVPGIHVLRP